VEKFRKCRFADVGKSELGKKEKRKKHAQNIRSTVHRTGDLKRTFELKLYQNGKVMKLNELKLDYMSNENELKLI